VASGERVGEGIAAPRDRRQGRTSLMGGVGDDAPLCLKGRVQRLARGIEGAG
jgi:hypothetical protein